MQDFLWTHRTLVSALRDFHAHLSALLAEPPPTAREIPPALHRIYEAVSCMGLWGGIARCLLLHISCRHVLQRRVFVPL